LFSPDRTLIFIFGVVHVATVISTSLGSMAEMFEFLMTGCQELQKTV